MPVPTITPSEFRDLLDDGDRVTVVDTRDRASYAGWHIDGAIRYRYDGEGPVDAAAFSEATGLDPDDSIVTVCAKGRASSDLAEGLAAAGYANVSVLAGGMEGWNALYDRLRLDVDDGRRIIIQLQRRAKGCLSYVVGDPTTGAAAVVDPPRHLGEVKGEADEHDLTIERVLETHVHADHLSGGPALADELGVPYHLGSGALDRDLDLAFAPLEPGTTVAVGQLDIEVLPTPGHTTESVSYLVGETAVLTGDTLFTDAVGRTELQFGAGRAAEGARALYRSLTETLFTLLEDVVVFPGHFEVTDDGRYPDGHPGEPIAASIGDVRAALSLADEATFVDRVTRTLPEKPPNYERIVAINSGYDRPADETAATELETGPNRCAAG